MWYDENPFYQAGYGMPNCTAYCWGRWYELLGEAPDLPLGDGNSWFPTAQEMGVYETGAYPGSEPALGAIICTYYDIGGHVAVVEQINEDGSIVTSNSGWQSTYFGLKHFILKTDMSPHGQTQAHMYRALFTCQFLLAQAQAQNPRNQSRQLIHHPVILFIICEIPGCIFYADMIQ